MPHAGAGSNHLMASSKYLDSCVALCSQREPQPISSERLKDLCEEELSASTRTNFVVGSELNIGTLGKVPKLVMLRKGVLVSNSYDHTYL